MGSVKLQLRPGGGFMVTLPAAVVKVLQLKGKENLLVFVDVETREVIYKVE
jgi:antitoxin component of MazEF toxin-antitoxin module